WITSKMALPEPETQDGNVVLARLVFAGSPGTAMQRPRAKQREEIGLGGDTDYVVGAPRVAEIHVMAPTGEAHILKAVILLLPIEEVWTREGKVSGSGFSLINPDQRSRIVKSKRPQQNCINHAENRCVCANPKRHSDNRNNCQSTGFTKIANPITQVLQQAFHKRASRLGAMCSEAIRR